MECSRTIILFSTCQRT